jgi:hypothetical protein
MKTLLRAVFAITVTAVLAAAVAVPSDAAPRHARARVGSFDGEWSVAISTSYGNCNNYRAALRIAGGRVMAAGGDFSAGGYVTPSGGISVTVSNGSGSAYGSGRLRGSQGAGRWRTRSGECAGTWYATRRGY